MKKDVNVMRRESEKSSAEANVDVTNKQNKTKFKKIKKNIWHDWADSSNKFSTKLVRY